MINQLNIPKKLRKRMGVDSLSISFNENEGKIERSIKDTQQWEPHIQNVLGNILKPEDIFLDIGANIGIHSVFASKLAKEVIAFEPSKKTFKHLLKTVELNNCDNITCHNIGLWDQDETRLFCHLKDDHGGSHFTTVDYHESNAIKSDVEVKRLDNLKIPHVDVVKIDVEGVEKFVLRGGGKLFDECPILFIEFNGKACLKHTGKDLLDTLYQIMSFGYRNIYYMAQGNSDKSIIIPPHPDSTPSTFWKKTNFDYFQTVIKNNAAHGNLIFTDVIFLPPEKVISGLV